MGGFSMTAHHNDNQVRLVIKFDGKAILEVSMDASKLPLFIESYTLTLPSAAVPVAPGPPPPNFGHAFDFIGLVWDIFKTHRIEIFIDTLIDGSALDALKTGITNTLVTRLETQLEEQSIRKKVVVLHGPDGNEFYRR